MINRSKSGFTLMEMTVIVFILLLIAAAATPRIVAYLQSEQQKSLIASIQRLPGKARTDSIRLQTPVRLRIDGSSIDEEEVPTVGDVTPLSQVDLGSTLQVDLTQKNYLNIETSSWNWTAYPDGTTDVGGVQFSIDGEPTSLAILSNGDARWNTGPLPDESQDQWNAGQLQQRVST